MNLVIQRFAVDFGGKLFDVFIRLLRKQAKRTETPIDDAIVDFIEASEEEFMIAVVTVIKSI